MLRFDLIGRNVTWEGETWLVIDIHHVSANSKTFLDLRRDAVVDPKRRYLDNAVNAHHKFRVPFEEVELRGDGR